nr:heavy metal-associated domain-containing protein [uncultured Flavobacterium sp.]
MKKSIALLALSTIFMVSCKDKVVETIDSNGNDALEIENVTQQDTTSNEVAGTMEKASFEVEGMSCAVGCAKVIEGKLAKLNGVKSATVDFETKKANVEFDNGKQSIESIQETVEKIGDGLYKVENMQSSLDMAINFQEPKKEKKECCSKSGKSCNKDKKNSDSKSDSKDKKSEKKANLL